MNQPNFSFFNSSHSNYPPFWIPCHCYNMQTWPYHFPSNSQVVCVLSYVQNFVSSWTIACQAPLSMEFSRQHWSGLPFPLSGDLLDTGMEPATFVSPALADRFFTTTPSEKPTNFLMTYIKGPFHKVSTLCTV